MLWILRFASQNADGRLSKTDLAGDPRGETPPADRLRGSFAVNSWCARTIRHRARPLRHGREFPGFTFEHLTNALHPLRDASTKHPTGMPRPFRHRSSLVFGPMGLSLLIFICLALWYKHGHVRTSQSSSGSETNIFLEPAAASHHEDILDEIVSFVVGIQRDQREAEAIFGKRFFEVGPVVANAEPNSLMLSRRDLSRLLGPGLDYVD